ncbi:Rv3654c family TadE-like protein [Acrocarpospora catenulata]|uniref:Rv3654c family TadE-like protein n=1 Tax=Acrocarpospora catenulata TaxID=2836182 RepID=UPI003556D5B5
MEERVDARERGSGTVWVVAVMGVVWVVVVIMVWVGVVRVGRHRAQVAADLGALAGAKQAFVSEDVACGEARRVVEANTAQLTSCVVSGGVVDVSVAVAMTLPGLGARIATAWAKAGPAEVGLP